MSPIEGPDLKIDITTTFPDSDIFGVKLVNGHPTKAVVEVENHEEGPVLVSFLGGRLATTQPLPEGAPPAAGILRNLTAVKYDTKIAAGDKRALTFNFVLDMNPQDVQLEIYAVVSNAEQQVFQVQAHSGVAGIVEAPTSFLDPQMYACVAPSLSPRALRICRPTRDGAMANSGSAFSSTSS